MASYLEILAGTDDPRFLHMVRSLETASGSTGQDVRLIADSAARFRKIVVDLGLDPSDTLGLELYGALLARVKTDNDRLAKLFGVKDCENPAEVLEAAVRAVRGANVLKSGWALKRPVAKKLIKNLPPKELMKCLKYRSVDSLLKHERVEDIYVLMKLTEPESWLKSFNRQYEQIKPNDFESRNVVITFLDKKNCPKLAADFFKKKKHSVLHNKEIGAVAVLLPEKTSSKGLFLQTVLYLLYYLNEVRLYSAYLKLRQVRSDFGRCVAKALSDDVGGVVSLAGSDVHWRTLFRALSGSSAAVARFQPYINRDDLKWQSVSEQLALLDKPLGFWQASESAGGVVEGRVFSANIFDISTSYMSNLPHSRAKKANLHEAVKNELMTRYASTVRLRSVALTQLDA